MKEHAVKPEAFEPLECPSSLASEPAFEEINHHNSQVSPGKPHINTESDSKKSLLQSYFNQISDSDELVSLSFQS